MLPVSSPCGSSIIQIRRSLSASAERLMLTVLSLKSTDFNLFLKQNFEVCNNKHLFTVLGTIIFMLLLNRHGFREVGELLKNAGQF